VSAGLLSHHLRLPREVGLVSAARRVRTLADRWLHRRIGNHLRIADVAAYMLA